MSTAARSLALALGVLLCLMLLAAALWAGSWLAHDRQRLQQLASQALGMEVQISGTVHLRLGPEPGVRVEGLRVRAGGADFIAAHSADIAIDLWSLLRRQPRVNRIALSQVSLTVRQDRAGRFNFENSTSTGSDAAVAPIQLSLRQTRLDYVNEVNGNTVRATGCRLDGSVAADGGGDDTVRRLAVTAQVACDEIQTRQWLLSRVDFSMAGRSGRLQFKPVSLEAYGGTGSAIIDADLTGSEPSFRVHYELSGFRLEQLSQTITPRKIGSGSLDFSTDLTLRGNSVDSLVSSSQGTASLHGQRLTLQVGDLDKQLSLYESSQHFNLVDVGAVLAVGPLGLLVTKGYDFTRLLNDAGAQNSQVQVLQADWQIRNGVAEARDVAMSTASNRLALTGKLDFVHRAYQDVTVALVNDQGCVRVKQVIRGPFSQPEIDKPNIVSSLVGPARHLLGEAKHLLGARCEVFYSGSLPAPKRKS